jgi:hypothetical protein
MTQDRPDAAELLDAVAEYLFAELRPRVPAEERFRVLVAANVCAVVAREIRAAEGPLRDDLALFADLLGEEPATADRLDAAVRAAQTELARRIRGGEMDDRLQQLAVALRDHLARKLAIARPGYDAEP